MNDIWLHFYEKPGCINNTRQKKILREAGVQLIVHDLLSTPWDYASLRPFFTDRPVAEWFNPSAPAVKEKRIRPAECSAAEAIAAMLKDPLLIRRPLLKVDDWHDTGFEWLRLQQQLRLGAAAAAIPVSPAIEVCAQTVTRTAGESE